MLDSIKNTRGFTLVELIVAITAGSIVSIVFVGFAIFFFLDTMKTQAETEMLIESQIILRQVADDMRFSSGILTSNTLPDANEPTGGWTTSNDDLILVLQQPARNNTTGEFIVDDITGEYQQNEFVYFSDDSMMYKRVLANSTATNNRSITTCPKELSSASCPSDPVFSNNFKDMDFIFYDQNGDVTTDPTLGRTVQINIELEQNVYGEIINHVNSIQMTLRNPNLE